MPVPCSLGDEEARLVRTMSPYAKEKSGSAPTARADEPFGPATFRGTVPFSGLVQLEVTVTVNCQQWDEREGGNDRCGRALRISSSWLRSSTFPPGVRWISPVAMALFIGICEITDSLL